MLTYTRGVESIPKGKTHCWETLLSLGNYTMTSEDRISRLTIPLAIESLFLLRALSSYSYERHNGQSRNSIFCARTSCPFLSFVLVFLSPLGRTQYANFHRY